MTFATLRALHTIIGAALDDIEAIYLAAASSSPSSALGLPSPLSPSPTTPAYKHAYPYSPTPSTPVYSPVPRSSSPAPSYDADSLSSYSVTASTASSRASSRQRLSGSGLGKGTVEVDPVGASDARSISDAHLTTPVRRVAIPSTPTNTRRLRHAASPSRTESHVSGLYSTSILPESRPVIRGHVFHRSLDTFPGTPTSVSSVDAVQGTASSLRRQFVSASASCLSILSTPQSVSRSSGIISTPLSHPAVGALAHPNGDPDGSPSPIKFAPNPHRDPLSDVPDVPHPEDTSGGFKKGGSGDGRPDGSGYMRADAHEKIMGDRDEDMRGDGSVLREAFEHAPDYKSRSYAADSPATGYPTTPVSPDVLATPTSASTSSSTRLHDRGVHPKSEAGIYPSWSSPATRREREGRKQRHRPTPLLPALTAMSRRSVGTPEVASQQEQGQLPPTPASLFSLSSVSRSSFLDVNNDGEDRAETRENAVSGLDAAWEEPSGDKTKGKNDDSAKRMKDRTPFGKKMRILDWPALDEPAYAVPSDQRYGVKEGEPGTSRDSPHAQQDASKAGGNGGRDNGMTLSEALTTHPAVLAAVSRIVAACGQLSASVQRPFLTVCDAAMGYHLPACLRLLEAAHIPEILREAGSRGLHVNEIARRVGEVRQEISRRMRQAGRDGEGQDMDSAPIRGRDTQDVDPKQSEEDLDIDPALLSHVLRLLATHHITREVRPNVFTNNRISGAIHSGRSVAELAKSPETKYEGTDGIAAYVALCTDELFKSAAYLTDCYLPPLEDSESQLPPLTPQSISTSNQVRETNFDHHETSSSKPDNASQARNAPPTPASATHSVLADLALGNAKSSRSIPDSRTPAPTLSQSPVDHPAVSTKRRPRALSIIPSPHFPRSPVSRRARATSIVHSSSSLTSAPLAGPLTPLSPSRTMSDTDVKTEPARKTADAMLKNPMHSPFNLAFRTQAQYFTWLEMKENVMRLKRFGPAMTGTSAWEVPGAIVDGFPWHSLSPGSLVVDVGGGIGSTSMLLAHAFPHLRFLVQDRPPVVKQGEVALRGRSPELLESSRVVFQAHDFFNPQPPLPMCLQTPTLSMNSSRDREKQISPAVFLLRVITHDWPDGYVTRILLQLRRAAGPDTKLLLADHILPLACIDEDSDLGSPRSDYSMVEKMKADPLPGTLPSLAPEGSPLLPNLGKASATAYWLDLTMRATFNAQERTLRELSALTQATGWRIVQVVRSESSLFGHISAVPVEIPQDSLSLLDTPLPEFTVESSEQGPPMGDTFCSFVDLPSEELVRKGVRASKRARASATQDWQARANEWKQRLVKKSSAIWKDRKTPSEPPPPSPLPISDHRQETDLLPAVNLPIRETRSNKNMSNINPTEGRREAPRGLRRMFSRAQLGGSGTDERREKS